MRPSRLAVAAIAVAVLTPNITASAQQTPLSPLRRSGQAVTPTFEGWYANADGSITLSFGYFNRNAEEVVEIPVGPDNFIEPSEFDGFQPTVFHPRQHWGVFGVVVPADLGDGEVFWTLESRGRTYRIPGSLRLDWRIDALEGEAGSGNTPPTLRFGEKEGAGPGGVVGDHLSGEVGVPLAISVWAKDDGRLRGSVASAGRARPITLTWFKHQGPGAVTFDEVEHEIDNEGGEANTTATFSVPGEYVLRVRANDASGVASAGHSQCCWTNGFLTVTITG